ncbi:hypothetical protein CBS101457_004330 [Exobasidium rhododendri]|nr:hypothetical protein CBS101457_004330 [Exobasidium rhododendri]
MLRSIALPVARKALRSASPATAASTTSVINVPVYKRTLVSTVLLSRDAYNDKKVSELKNELKSRGLATNGKRSDLVDRLLDNDTSNSRVFSGSDSNQQQSTRNASTQSKKESVKPSPSPNVAGAGEKATISHPPGIEPGQVSSNVAEVADGFVVPEKVLETQSPAPGVPPEKTARVPIVFEVKIPYEKIPVDAGPEIPLMTGYFHPESPMYHGEHSPDDGPIAHLPKVITISGEDAKEEGRVSHHVADFEDPTHSKEERSSASQAVEEEQTLTSAIHSLFNNLGKDMGIEVAPAAKKEAVEGAISTLESTKTILKEARESLSAQVGSSSSGSGSSSASYSTSTSYSGGSTRPLNDDEIRGLYVLAGIVGTGFLLGGLGKPSKKQIEKVKVEIAKKAEEAKEEVHPLPVPDAELAELVAKAELALPPTPEGLSIPGKGRAGKAFGGLK